jgi:pSer/pThr/pTyr-binding forkhead associated (FHA) protein
MDEALRSERGPFVADNECLFAVGTVALRRPRQAHSTIAFRTVKSAEEDDEQQDTNVFSPWDTLSSEPAEHALVAFPVRKRQPNYPHMITIGRTQNNDIVIPDVSVSKFHAFFRVPDEPSPDARSLELCDAGSRNGTCVNGERLAPKQPVLVHVNDSLRFGQVDLSLVDAGTLWDRVHKGAR